MKSHQPQQGCTGLVYIALQRKYKSQGAWPLQKLRHSSTWQCTGAATASAMEALAPLRLSGFAVSQSNQVTQQALNGQQRTSRVLACCANGSSPFHFKDHARSARSSAIRFRTRSFKKRFRKLEGRVSCGGSSHHPTSMQNSTNAMLRLIVITTVLL